MICKNCKSRMKKDNLMNAYFSLKMGKKFVCQKPIDANIAIGDLSASTPTCGLMKIIKR